MAFGIENGVLKWVKPRCHIDSEPDEGRRFCRIDPRDRCCALPESLKAIEEHAFWGCHVLKEITIPAGVGKIRNRAFCQMTWDWQEGENLDLRRGEPKGSYAEAYAKENCFAFVCR